ncbi:MAG: hypothetical protein LBK23_11770 [Oscillospiraceae bacterium]|jgi:hypothetical protein|nr:hypothetical protein [Oscillospiraceae bacterium]
MILRTKEEIVEIAGGAIKSVSQLQGKMSQVGLKFVAKNDEGKSLFDLEAALALFGIALEVTDEDIDNDFEDVADENDDDGDESVGANAPFPAPPGALNQTSAEGGAADGDPPVIPDAPDDDGGDGNGDIPPPVIRVMAIKPFRDVETGRDYRCGELAEFDFERIRELNTHPFGPFVWEPEAGKRGIIKPFSYLNKWYDAGAVVPAEDFRYAGDAILDNIWNGV